MATIEFVNALITLWNERVENFNLNPVEDVTFKPQIKSIEDFHKFMDGQTTVLIDNRTFYQYSDVSGYLHGMDIGIR